MKKKVARLVRERRLTRGELNDTCISLVERYPRGLCWLRVLPCARRHCLTCAQPEPCTVRPVSRQFRQCSVCSYVYCLECWNDLQNICYYCLLANEDDDTDLESDSENEEKTSDWWNCGSYLYPVISLIIYYMNKRWKRHEKLYLRLYGSFEI